MALLGDFASRYKFPLDFPNQRNPQRDFTPASVKIGFLQTPLRKSTFAHTQDQITSFSLNIDHFRGENPMFPQPSILPQGITLKTLYHTFVIHPKGEFDPYTFSPFDQMKKAWTKRASQIFVPVPLMSVSTKPQRLENEDKPSLTRKQHEELLVEHEIRTAESHNRALMVLECILMGDPDHAAAFALDIVFQNMGWTASTRRERVALVYQMPSLAVQVDTEDAFITQNMAGNLAASMKASSELDLFLKKHGSLSATTAGTQASSAADGGSRSSSTAGASGAHSPSTALSSSYTTPADTPKDTSTREEISALIREELRASRGRGKGGRGKGGSSQAGRGGRGNTKNKGGKSWFKDNPKNQGQQGQTGKQSGKPNTPPSGEV
jgi:hypothetical protein